MMGLCGSLRDRFQVGDIVLYSECVYKTQLLQCSRSFTAALYAHLQDKVSLVKGLYHVRLINRNKKILNPCRDVAVLRLYIICNKPVMILSCDRVVCSAKEKLHLSQTSKEE